MENFGGFSEKPPGSTRAIHLQLEQAIGELDYRPQKFAGCAVWFLRQPNLLEQLMGFPKISCAHERETCLHAVLRRERGPCFVEPVAIGA